MKKTIKLGFMDTREQQVMRPLNAEIFEQIMNSEHVRSVMSQIETASDESKKNALKAQLPVAFYACQLTASSQRPSAHNGLVVPTGLCLHDWDKMEVSPRQFYAEHLAGREEELHIVLAHVTPRGQGLRLVTELPDGQSIAECQQQLAAQFGMQGNVDAVVKDYTRLSYIPSSDYLLYINNVGLFERPYREMQVVTKAPAVMTPAVEANATHAVTTAPSAEAAPEQTQPSALQCVADNLFYEGIKYSTIIEALIKRLANHGEVSEGQRNNLLFSLVRELRHICNYNFQMVYMLVSPYFQTLPDGEIRRTIGSAIATNGRTITPMMRGVINELKNIDVDLDDVAEEKQIKLPPLAPIEEMILSHYPKHLRTQLYCCMLPIWGTYATHVRFDHLDGREHSLSFMTSLVGKSGSGKSAAAHLFEQMTQRLEESDKLERLKADQYQAICNKAGEGAQLPDDPRPKVRLYGDDITTSQLLEYLDNLDGMHGLQFTEEVARLNKSKRSFYGDNDDLYCKAFDNALGGKESKSKLTRNIRIKIFLNTLFLGTPGAQHKFYNNPEGGLNNRVTYAFMPNHRMKGFPKYEKFTDEERKQFEAMLDELMEAGKDGQKVDLPWLDRTIMQIKNKWDREDDENPDEVWYDLGKRSLDKAKRAGVLEWLLRGRPDDEKQQRAISRVVKAFAEIDRQNGYRFSGKAYEELNEQDNAMQQQQQHLTKNKKLFSLLADEFTTQDLIALRVQNGGNANVAMVICRWVSDGLVRKVSDHRYQKVPQAC